MGKTYGMEIAGLHRELPLCAVSDTLDIGAFIMFNDVEITVAAATELLKKCPEFDIIVTPEAKSIPLAYEMARQSGKPYYVARKGKKVYMPNPVGVDVQSITTQNLQQLYMDQSDLDAMKGKKLLLVDDVISTGESIKSMESLLEGAGLTIVGEAAVLAEGDAANNPKYIFLEPLPLFFKEKE